MRDLIRAGLSVVLLLGCVTTVPAAEAGRSAGKQALLTAAAVAANITPVVPSFYTPRCLPGYVFCKALYAATSVIAAADQLVFSGGADMAQTRAILFRGFGGDWVMTPRHIAGEASPEPLPEPPPPADSGEGGWQPPPL
jgi:hypothetical protein